MPSGLVAAFVAVVVFVVIAVCVFRGRVKHAHPNWHLCGQQSQNFSAGAIATFFKTI